MTDLGRREFEFLLYTAPDGAVKVGVLFRDETAWLTQKALAELFGVGVPAINKHLKNIFESGELEPAATISKMEIVRSEGGRDVARTLEFYNLDAIIAVGYRVNSYQATQFRIWATKTLREFMIKGFVLDDKRLKQGKTLFGKDYFDELLERIREIRASERRFYQKITDIYALAVDYDAHAPLTRDFFETVQNKLHWAITGQTAAELIYASVDAMKLFMGLTTWQHAPQGKVLKSDVTVAKNYLSEAHVKELNRIVSGVPRSRREPSAARHPDEDGRLGDLPEQLPRAVELSDPRGQEEAKRLEGSAGPKAIGAGSANARGVTKPDKAPSKGEEVVTRERAKLVGDLVCAMSAARRSRARCRAHRKSDISMSVTSLLLPSATSSAGWEGATSPRSSP